MGEIGLEHIADMLTPVLLVRFWNTIVLRRSKTKFKKDFTSIPNYIEIQEDLIIQY